MVLDAVAPHPVREGLAVELGEVFVHLRADLPVVHVEGFVGNAVGRTAHRWCIDGSPQVVKISKERLEEIGMEEQRRPRLAVQIQIVVSYQVFPGIGCIDLGDQWLARMVVGSVKMDPVEQRRGLLGCCIGHGFGIAEQLARLNVSDLGKMVP